MESITGVVSAWHEAITDGRLFNEERDSSRFKAAFRTISQRCTSWPSPKEFLEALPRIEGEPQHKRMESEQSRIMGMKAMAEIAALLGIEKPEDNA